MQRLAKILLVVWTLVVLPTTAVSQQYEFVPERDTSLIKQFRVSDHSLVQTFRGGANPASLAMSPNGRLLFSAGINSTYVSVIDVTLGAEVLRINGPRLISMGQTPDGHLIGGASAVDDNFFLISTAGRAMKTGGFGPGVSMQVSLAGQMDDAPGTQIGFGQVLAVSNSKFFVSSDTGLASVTSAGVVQKVSLIPALGFQTNGAARSSLALSADGTELVNARGPYLFVVNANTGGVTNVFNTGAPISAIAFSPVSLNLYALRINSGQLVISTYNMNPASPQFGTLSSQSVLVNPAPPVGPVLLRSTMRVSNDGSQLFVAIGFYGLSPNSWVINTATSAMTSYTDGESLSTIELGNAQLPAVTNPQPSQTIANNVGGNVPVPTIGGGGIIARIGNLDPVQVISAPGGSFATVPPGQPAQIGKVIEINASGTDIASELVSQVVGAVAIVSPASFMPTSQVVVANAGEATLGTMNTSSNTSIVPTVPAMLGVYDLAYTSDGSYVYGANLREYVTALNLQNGTVQQLHVSNDAGGILFGIAAGSPAPGTSRMYISAISAADDIQLLVLDATPGSDTFNTVIQTMNAGLSNIAGYIFTNAATQDGHYVFTPAFYSDEVGNFHGELVIFDTIAQSATTVQTDQWNIGGSVRMVLTSGDTLLLMEGNDGSLKVLNVANATSPFLQLTIPAIAADNSATEFDSFEVYGTLLYSVDSIRGEVTAYNFDIAGENFSPIGTYTFGGSPGLSDVDISPDGTTLYVAMNNTDSVGVLNAAAVAASSPGALVTSVRTGLGAYLARIRPGTPTNAGTGVVVQPLPDVTLTFSTVYEGGTTSVAVLNSTGVTVPPGFQLFNPPVFYQITTNASYAPPVSVCFNYDPTQLNNPLLVVVLQQQGNVFVPQPTAVDTNTNQACAQVQTLTGLFAVAFASTPQAGSSISITQPLSPTQVNLFTFGTFNYKVQYPPHTTFAPVDMTVTATFTPQSVYAGRVGETSFSASKCIVYDTAGGNCVIFSISCTQPDGITPAPCPPSPDGSYDVFVSTSYDTSQSITNPGFLHAPTGTDNWENIFTSFSLFKVDPTTTGKTKNFSDFVAVDLGVPPGVTAGTFGGFGPPLAPQNPRVFSVGYTIPVKVTATSVSNPKVIVSNASVFLSLAKGTVSIPFSQANKKGSNNQLIYNPVLRDYEYYLSTVGLAPGTYSITVYSNSFSAHTVSFQLH